jgi:hypothetical protein
MSHTSKPSNLLEELRQLQRQLNLYSAELSATRKDIKLSVDEGYGVCRASRELSSYPAKLAKRDEPGHCCRDIP